VTVGQGRYKLLVKERKKLENRKTIKLMKQRAGSLKRSIILTNF